MISTLNKSLIDAAHEEHIKTKHPKVEVTRHSPTAFTAIEQPRDKISGGKLINSNITGNILHSTISEFNHPEYSYKTPNIHLIESNQQ